MSNLNEIEAELNRREVEEILSSYYLILYFLFKNPSCGKKRTDKEVYFVYDPSKNRRIETFYFKKIKKYCVKETLLTTALVPHKEGTLIWGASPTIIDSKINQKWFKNQFNAIYYFATLVDRVDEIEEYYKQYINHPYRSKIVDGFKEYISK